MTRGTALLADLVRDALPGVEAPPCPGAGETAVGGVTCDTRTMAAGDLFVVVPGSTEDGARYAADAVARGARALVAAPAAAAALRGLGAPVFVHPRPREALGRLAASFHGRPSEALTVVGVTGTNGKTTAAHLLRSVLDEGGRGPSAVLGTIAYAWPGHEEPAPNTTPGAHVLQDRLARAREAGCRAAVLEVSSHALDQDRVAGVRFAGAVYTNLSGDHLDYHGDMESYAAAKERLFSLLDADGVAAVNGDDERGERMAAACAGRVVRYGRSRGSDVTARRVRSTARGLEFELVTPAGTAEVQSPLLGRYNLLNLLAAAALAEGLGLSPWQVARGLSALAGVRGRLERVDAGQPFTVLVDYAHTDDAVANVLANLRDVVPGRLLAVLGCGGDRDRTKRPRMARVAADLADRCWFTSDNPRTEDPLRILDDMREGVVDARNVQVEPDRAAAIGEAIAAARSGDCVAVLGKGHEDYQILGNRRVPFDDRDVALRSLQCVAGSTDRPIRAR